MTPTIEEIAERFNCTPEQVKAQFAKNAKQLCAMARQARRSGKRVNGFTAKQLSGMTTKFTKLAQ